MRRFAFLLVLAVLNLLLTLWLTQPRLSAQASHDGGALRAVSLPWQFDAKAEAARLRLTVEAGHAGLAPSGRWRIVPDEEIRSVLLNGQPVSLDHIPEQARRDWTRGFELDLDLQPGRNELEFVVRNEGGPGGVQLHLYPSWSTLTLLWLSGALLIFALNALLPLSWGQRAILLLALIPLLTYWSGTPWSVRSHDVGGLDGHFAYVQWIADRLSLPRPDAGWTFYHPPLYYMAGALVVRLGDVFGLDRAILLQLFSLGLWLVFLVASAATMRRLLRGPGAGLLIATAALAFWPSGIIHSIRIGNDAAAYACCGLLAYCLIGWWKTGSRRALIGMGIFAVLALLSKTSVLAIVAVAGLATCWKVVWPGRAGRVAALKPVLWIGACVTLGVGLSVARNLYYYMRGELSGWLVGNEGSLNAALRVPVELKSFIPLDIPTFLTFPWANAWDDASGRANFWNYLLRSALSGEFSFAGTWSHLMAWLMGAALLALCVLMLKRVPEAFAASPLARYRQLPMYGLLVLWLASLFALRIKTPYSCSNDFRYILPVLLPFLVMAVQSGTAARILLGLISLASFSFFMAM